MSPAERWTERGGEEGEGRKEARGVSQEVYAGSTLPHKY